ncbi:MAG TPA: tetratricopeptide repeat protein, partial [Kofleriaceae bacterium]|nr:tetratricopeptide repeat protein [Kofleriaceae bacterium]
EALAALATLYEKDKRYLALADVYRRQHENARTPAESVQILERLGALFAERLRATGAAAEIYQQILQIDRSHPRAARTLRELYSQSGDYDALQNVYAQLGQWDELVESFHNIADRVDDRTVKLDLLERAARVAAERSSNQERIARAWERVLSVDPKNLGAARALVPIYAKTGKSARLLAVYEILLDHAEDDDRRLQLLGEIRSLCEDRLGSKVLAFQWAARAYQLRPADPRLLADLERLGAEADAWDEVATLLDERIKSSEVSREERLGVLRELGKIASVRLHQADRAQQYWERVLAELPEDREAMAALEEIATHQAHWPDLLRIYRRRVDLEPDRDKQIDLLFRIAFLEEERLADLDAAVATYRRIIELDPASRRALKALGKLSEARGDWSGMADVLERDLALTAEVDVKVQLLLRLGGLQENNLGQPDRALESYKKALALSPSAQIHRLIERFMTESWPSEVRRDVASLLLPAYEQADDAERMARAIEILRTGETGQALLDRDRRLVHLYSQRLGRPDQAYLAALRVLEAEPSRADIREELARLADQTGMTGDYADHLELVLEMVEEKEGGDAEVRRALASDLAELCVDRLVDLERAERAWRKVLAIDASDQTALAGLERIYRTTGRWADLRALCEEQLDHTLDNARRIDLLFAVADLGETMLGDIDGAIAAYGRALDVDPSLMRAYKALERLHEGNNRWSELEELLTREQEHLGDKDAQVPVLVRRARIRADKLGNKNGALDLLEEVIARQRGNADARELVEELLTDPGERLRVARLLEPLYQEDGLWRDLCLVLRAQREFAASREEAAEFHARIAQVEEEKLGHERGAFDTWREVLALLPADERARQHIIRLAAGLGVWDEAVIALEKSLGEIPADDVASRTAILRDIANIAEDELRDPSQAQSAYRRLLDADPGNPETARLAAQALDRLYVESGDWRALIDIVRRQADWAEAGPERLGFLTRLAVLEEERAGNPKAAIAAWREVLNEDAEDRPALDALERLYQQGGAIVELADIIRRRVELAADPADKKRNLVRLARLHERELENPQEAVGAWLEVLDFMPEDVESLDELARLYRAGARHADLLEILERRLLISRDPRERLALTFELGELLSVHLGRDAEALEHYADVLSHDGGHAGALARIEGMLDDEDLRLRAADVLLPLYEKQGEWGKLAGLLVRVADAVGDPRSRLRHLRRVAEIRENKLGDRAGALAAYKDAVAAAVAEPDLRDLLRELERVAAEEGRLGDLIDVYQEIAPDVFDGELQRRLHLDIADLARGVRRDDQLARRYYQMVLEAQPDDRRALDAVEGIYRDAGDHEALYEALLRKAELAGDDLEARAEALAMAASLCQEQLKRPVDAMVVWEQVLELLPDSREAAEALEGLYTQSERWHDLTDLIERRLGFAFTVEEAVRLRYRLGQICEIHLHDPDRAVENYSAALGGDPGHGDATRALERFLDDPGTRAEAAEVLEPIYVSHQNWPRLVRIYEIKLESATDPGERLQLMRYIARLHEDQLEDLEGAFRWYGRVFKENPAEPGLRSQLVRLAGVLDSWGALAHIYQEFLDDTPGDSPEAQEVALALAELADR